MKTSRFTLIEVLIAVVILALSLGVTLAIIAQSRDDLIRARDRWLVQHAMEQASEYFLLTSPADLSISENILPDGFRAECQIEAVSDGLPEFAAVEDYRGWTLGAYKIDLYDSSGDFRAQNIIQKLVPKDVVY